MSERETNAVWVTFAVPEEAGPFRRGAPLPAVRVILTGMGADNARRTVRAALARGRPSVLISGGFAGGLNPAWARGTVGFEVEKAEAAWRRRLEAAGAVAGRFHQSDRIAVTPAEKAALRAATGADAVEMESGAIREACRAHGVPCVVARVISDAANEALPLDFNRLLGPDHRLRYGRLAARLLGSPGKIPELIRFHRQARESAERLAEVLRTAIPAAR